MRASSLGIRLPHSRSQCRPTIRSLHTPEAALQMQHNTRDASIASSQESNHRELPHQGFPVGRPWQRNPIPYTILPRSFRRNRNPQGKLDGAGDRAMPRVPIPNRTKSSRDSRRSHDILSSESLIAAAEELTTFPSAPDKLSIDTTDPYYSCLQTLAETQSVAKAWDAYSAILALPRPKGLADGQQKIPLSILRRLSILLVGSKPKTRELFLRLLSVLQHIHMAGGTLQVHQWNALVAAAGNGWRKKRLEDFKLALDIYNDMISHKAPGSTLSGSTLSSEEEGVRPGGPAKPDIFTYTTLITIAARTLSGPALHHATSLLKSSGLSPNRITHLALLRYFTHTKQLSGVRSTLSKMREQGLEVGLDGVNACMWAYSHNDRMDLVSMVYRVLRHHVSPELTIGQHDIDATIEHLASVEGIVIPHGMVPNGITYTIMLQTLAYHGDLIQSLNVFMDMLSSLNGEVGAPLYRGVNGKLKSGKYLPTLPAFRAVFLGFARHAEPPPKEDGAFSMRLRSLSNESPWTLSHLEALFESFITLPGHARPQPLVYWIMVAFAKTSGNDIDKLREVWKRLEDRFDGPWGGAANRLRRLRQTLFTHKKRKDKG